jgi:CAAX protease family protein
MRAIALQFALQIATILLVLFVTRIRHWSLRDNLGLTWPATRQVALWFAIFIMLLIAEEIASRRLGLPTPASWRGQYAPFDIALRVVNVVLTAPAFEELVFRGVVYDRVSHTPAGPIGAIVVAAVLFAGLHIQYSRGEIAFILIDGLFYGVVRYATGSVVLTFAMHSLGNLYAVVERLRAQP